MIADQALLCTPSIGAVLLRPLETLEAFIQRADDAMYAAKSASRIDDEVERTMPTPLDSLNPELKRRGRVLHQ